MPTRLLALASLALLSCTHLGDDAPGNPSGAGKADDPNGVAYPIFLQQATAEEVAQQFEEEMSDQLGACFDAYRAAHNPDAKMITTGVISQLQNDGHTGGGCTDAWDLRQTLLDILEDEGRAKAYPSFFDEHFFSWAVGALQPAVVDGYVGYAQLDLRFYVTLRTTEERNAVAREQDPTGVSLVSLRDTWERVQSHTTLDRDFYHPVVVDPAALETSEIFAQMRAAFPISSLSLVATGHKAIQEFWDATEGPEGDPEFAPIAGALKEPSIRKRFFFAGGGTGWSSNVLVVVDEHGQAFALQMGYSE